MAITYWTAFWIGSKIQNLNVFYTEYQILASKNCESVMIDGSDVFKKLDENLSSERMDVTNGAIG